MSVQHVFPPPQLYWLVQTFRGRNQRGPHAREAQRVEIYNRSRSLEDVNTLGAPPRGSPFPGMNRCGTTSVARFRATKMLPPMFWRDSDSPPKSLFVSLRDSESDTTEHESIGGIQEHGRNGSVASSHPPCTGRIQTCRNRRTNAAPHMQHSDRPGAPRGLSDSGECLGVDNESRFPPKGLSVR